ncbi:MAG: glycosyl hydrolase 53 family protein [Bacteroidota bacterium]|nr:glycosyl hydrolase 53 family protein [Bacteroidota bacterium]
MRKAAAIIFSLFLIATASCKKTPAVTPTGTGQPTDSIPASGQDTSHPFFAKGADVSWVTQMVASGYQFYDSAGTRQDCMQILKGLGMNAIRLRAWVNPANGWCNTTDVLAKALRAKSLGMKILLDFHYSDVWADPGHQTIPAAWAGEDLAGLTQSLTQYTTGVLDTLQLNGITPDWVQIGNETNDGMLWPVGQASVSMANFAHLEKAGYDAVKAVDTSIKVIVHISNGFDNSLFRWVFDGLKSNGGKWDIIGMSLYPSTSNWGSLNAQCLANMNDMVSRYGTPVMVVEIGMPWDQPAICKSFISDLVAKVKSVPGNMGLGVFYWEPECYNNWQNYTLGAFDGSGKPTAALSGFQ